jgi:peptidyl-prolyl cis-trans isomerase SurA
MFLLQLKSHKHISVLFGLLIILGGVFCFFLILAPENASSAEVVDRIVAVVNDEVISLYELNQTVAPYIQKLKASQYPPDVERQVLFELRSQILNEMINQKLTDQELKQQNISVSDREVDSTIERMKESRQITDEELRNLLSNEGISYEEYKEQTKRQLLRARLVNREVRSKIVITEQDIKDYYEQHIAEYAGENKYRLRNIFVRVSPMATDAERSSARKLMESVLAELKLGKPFEVVKDVESDSGLQLEGGDLGEFKLEDLSSHLSEVIEELNTGEFTPVLEEPFGYQIVYIEKKIDTSGKSLAEASDEIEDKLFNQVVDQRYESWLQSLRDRSHIKIIN